jgi:hypothetical protein
MHAGCSALCVGGLPFRTSARLVDGNARAGMRAATTAGQTTDRGDDGEATTFTRDRATGNESSTRLQEWARAEPLRPRVHTSSLDFGQAWRLRLGFLGDVLNA